MYRKAVIASAVVIASLVGAIGIVYAFGTPQAPTTPPTYAAAPAAPEGAVSAPQGGSPMGGTVTEVPEGGVPEPDENAPLAIQIPGCTCHSDDPKLVEQHSKYRMNQCAGCHGGKTPTGQ